MNGITYDFFSEDESWLVDDLLDAKRRSKAFTVITNQQCLWSYFVVMRRLNLIFYKQFVNFSFFWS